MQIKFENPKLEKWFLAQMGKAEAVIARTLEKVEALGHFDKQSIERAVYHASVIDMELIQLMNKRYNDFIESDETGVCQ
jgi:hypothetical protein